MSTSNSTSNVTDQLRSIMREYWGYEDFRPLQERAMVAGMSGHDSLVVLPTGGGKSLCYQVPALCLHGMAVVISPLISLMKDQVDALRACGVSVAFINSTLSASGQRNVADDIRERRLKLLYVAPESVLLPRVMDLIGETDVSFFAIDEAHCVSMWGHDFRPQYRQLSRLRERFPDVAIHGYTATASEQVRDDVVRQLTLRDAKVLVGSFDRPNLTYRVERHDNLFGQIKGVLDRHPDESGIIYCITKKKVDELSSNLNAAGYSTRPYHAGMSADEREANQEAFSEDRCRTIVATIAFGMGIDKSDVRYVVHAGLPKSLENYQQESGRAGRDGLEAECCLFYSGSDYKTWEFIINKSEGSPDFKHAQLASLKQVMDYCDGLVCRHKLLVQHFGQLLDMDCGEACDICLGELDEVRDPLIIGQKILSSVYRQNERFGADYTAQVLKGSRAQRIVENGHDNLSTHGLLKDEPKQTIVDWIGQLVSQGFLKKIGEYNTLSITATGWQLLRGEVTLRLLEPARSADTSGGLSGSSRRSFGKRRHTPDPHSWEGVDRGLFDLLRSFRTQLAADAEVPPFVIFGDASLRDMARRRPADTEAFLTVHGVGQKKCDDFAEAFTGLIRQHCCAHSLETNIDPPPPTNNDVTRLAKSPPGPRGPSASARQAFELFDAGKSIDDVAAEMGRASSTTRDYLAEYIRHRNITDPVRWVDPPLIGLVEEAIAAVGPARLKPIRDQVGDEISYNTIRIVATCWQNRHAENESPADTTDGD
jgi:ATP-dependent DNA helicase RecQ